MSLWYYLLRFKNKIDNYYSRIDSCDKTNSLAFPKSKGHSVVSNSLRPHGLYSPWNSPGQNTRVGSFSLLQGIFPTQGSNPGLPHCSWILYQLNYQGSLKKQRPSQVEYTIKL